MQLKVEFAGGSELLFDAKAIELEVEDELTITQLIATLCEKFIKRDKHLFTMDGKIRPGILILVNEVDFEVLGNYEYRLKPGDVVLFVSTLHGG